MLKVLRVMGAKLSPSVHKFNGDFIQTSAERLDMSSSTCLSRSPQDLVLPSALSSLPKGSGRME